MSFSTYSDLETQVANWLHRSDLTTYIPDFITLFEAVAARRMMVRPQETTTILVPSAPTATSVSNAANNGSGLIRLTINSTSTLATGQEVVVADIQGTTEANGSWIVSVIDSTHIDLQNSTFTNTYTSGTGTVTALSGVAALPSDYLGWKRVTWTGSPITDLQYVHPSVLQSYFDSVTSDIPQLFTIEGGNIIVRPVSGTTLEFVYYAKTAAVSGTLNWLYTNWPDAYLNGVLYEAYKFTKDPDNAAFYKAARDEIFDEIRMVNFKQAGHLSIRPLGPIV